MRITTAIAKSRYELFEEALNHIHSSDLGYEGEEIYQAKKELLFVSRAIGREVEKWRRIYNELAKEEPHD